MFRAYSFLFIFCAGLILTFYAQNYTHAQSIEEVIAKPPPQVTVQVIPTSAGPLNCYRIKEGFWHGKWVTEHRICQYQNDRSMVWVEEHWTCYKYDDDNVCMTWIKWSSGWNKTNFYIVKTRHIHRLYTPCSESNIPVDTCGCEY